jgi:methyl-accepting chemotaxis protein
MVLNLGNEGTDRLAEAQGNLIQGREQGYLRVAHVVAGFIEGYREIEPENRRPQFTQLLRSILLSEPNLVGIFVVMNPNALDGMDAAYAGQPGQSPEGIYAPMFTRDGGSVQLITYDDVPAALTFINGPNSRQSYMKNPVQATVNGVSTYTFRVVVPIVDPVTQATIGVAGIRIQIDALQPVVEQTIAQHEDIAAMAVYASDGTVIASYMPDRIGKNARQADAGLYGDYLDQAMDAILGDGTTHIKAYSAALQSNLEIAIFSFYITDGESWTVMIGTPEEVILEEVRRLTMFTVAIAVGAALLTAVIIFLVATSISKPIVNVAMTLKDISEGEGDLTKTIHINSKDEIGDLAQYFNQTLEKIKNLIIIIRDKSQALEEIGVELASNMTETAASMNQITANVQSVKNQVINQSASVTETNSTMEQITGNIEKLGEQIENQSASVTESSSAIEEMIANIASVTQVLVRNADNVKNLSRDAETGRVDVHAVSTDIEEVAKESEGLLEINAVMQSIASQTNLLSMNAAIEAAHAGEAGKGFAVVADEIRKLAESSGEQSKTVSTTLKKIKESMDRIHGAIGAVLKNFEQIDQGVRIVSEQEGNIRNAMEEQGTGSKQILQAITALNEVTQKVQSGSEEMLTGSREVITESRNLGRISAEISDSMNEMSAGADQVNIAVNRVNEITMDNKTNIDALVSEISKFKVE